MSGLAASSSAPPRRSRPAGAGAPRAARQAPALRAPSRSGGVSATASALSVGVLEAAVSLGPGASLASRARLAPIGAGRIGAAGALAVDGAVRFGSPSPPVRSASLPPARATKAGRGSGGRKGGRRGGAAGGAGEGGVEGGGEGEGEGDEGGEDDEGSVRSRALERLRRSKLRSAARAVEAGTARRGVGRRAGGAAGEGEEAEEAEEGGAGELVDGPLLGGVEAAGAASGSASSAVVSASSPVRPSGLSVSSPPRRRSRRFAEALARAPGRGVPLPPREAVSLALSLRSARFVESLEVHARVGLDPRRADQQLRGVAELPHGGGKRKRVWVICEGIGQGQRGGEVVGGRGQRGGDEEDGQGQGLEEPGNPPQDAANGSSSPYAAFLAGGAARAGGDDLIALLSSSPSSSLLASIDAIVATKAFLPKLARLGRLLGPRGLMPSPKTGTLVADAPEALRALAAIQRGRVAFKLDRASCLHAAVARTDLGEDRALENLLAFLRAVERHRPRGAGGGAAGFWKKLTLATTMGPGIDVDLERIRDT